MASDDSHLRLNSYRNKEGISRRRALTVGSMGLTALVAGCLGDDDDDPSTDDDSSADDLDAQDDSATDDVVDQWHVHHQWEIPTDAHFNGYNPTQYEGDSALNIFDPLAQHSPSNDEWYPLIAEDWTIDGDVFEVTIRDDYKWHDGKSLAAEDVALKLNLEVDMEMRLADFVDSIEVEGEIVRVNLLEPANPGVMEGVILETLIDTHPDIYGEYRERFQDGETEETQEDLFQFEPELDQTIGNGPTQVLEADTNRLLLERFADYPNGALNFQGHQVEPVESNEERVQGSIGGRFDGAQTNLADEEIKEQLPLDSGFLVELPGWHGSSLMFNNDVEDFQNVEVRQALAYVMNAEQIAPSIWGPLQTIEVEYPVGIIPDVWDTWLDGVLEEYNRYEQDFDAAATLLERNDYTEEDGQWYKPDGDPFRFSMTIPAAWDTQIGGYTTAQAHFQDFGIDAELETVDNTAYFGNTLPNHDFEAAWASWGSGPHPWFSFQEMRDEYSGDYAQQPAEVELPPLGTDPLEEDPDTETVNVDDLMADLGLTDDPEEEEEIVQQLCWYINWQVPQYISAQKIDLLWWRTEEWDVPEEGDPRYGLGFPWHYIDKFGDLQAKQ